jgi:hypothetical protein
MSDLCNACGGEKPDDKFRACPTCRELWRKYGKQATTMRVPLEPTDAMIRAGINRFRQFGNPANGMHHAYIAMLAESKRGQP